MLPKLLARLVRITGNIDIAEELAQDVLVTALERWPRDGMPDNPAAWLMQAAKHRGIATNRGRRARVTPPTVGQVCRTPVVRGHWADLPSL